MQQSEETLANVTCN